MASKTLERELPCGASAGCGLHLHTASSHQLGTVGLQVIAKKRAETQSPLAWPRAFLLQIWTLMSILGQGMSSKSPEPDQQSRPGPRWSTSCPHSFHARHWHLAPGHSALGPWPEEGRQGGQGPAAPPSQGIRKDQMS